MCFSIMNDSLSFQKWPCTNISPIESLLVVFGYEKQTRKTVTVDEIRDGMLGPKLTQQDFDMALQVKLITSTPFTPLFEKIVCKLFRTHLAQNQCINPLNRTTRKTCLLIGMSSGYCTGACSDLSHLWTITQPFLIYSRLMVCALSIVTVMPG